MDNKTLILFSAIVVVCIAILFGLNMGNIIKSSPPARFIEQKDVKGVAVERKDKLYTLSLNQQTRAIDYLNQSLPVGKEIRISNKDAGFSKLIIYRFEGKDITLTAVGLKDYDIIFQAPEWNPEGYLEDISFGSFHEMILETYDQ